MAQLEFMGLSHREKSKVQRNIGASTSDAPFLLQNLLLENHKYVIL